MPPGLGGPPRPLELTAGHSDLSVTAPPFMHLKTAGLAPSPAQPAAVISVPGASRQALAQHGKVQRRRVCRDINASRGNAAEARRWEQGAASQGSCPPPSRTWRGLCAAAGGRWPCWGRGSQEAPPPVGVPSKCARSVARLAAQPEGQWLRVHLGAGKCKGSNEQARPAPPAGTRPARIPAPGQVLRQDVTGGCTATPADPKPLARIPGPKSASPGLEAGCPPPRRPPPTRGR